MTADETLRDARKRVSAEGEIGRLNRQLAAVESEISAEADRRECRKQAGLPPSVHVRLIFRDCAGNESQMGSREELRNAIRNEIREFQNLLAGAAGENEEQSK